MTLLEALAFVNLWQQSPGGLKIRGGGSSISSTSNSLCQFKVSSLNFVLSGSDFQCFFGSHDYQQFLGPWHSGIQKIALEEHVVRNMDGHHHQGIFASLGLMN
jgi:hypothetical protein